MVLGHEITGEVIEKGRDVEYLQIGDLVSVPFNRRMRPLPDLSRGDTGVCFTSLPTAPAAPMDMSIWADGSRQADYVMGCPTRFHLLKFPTRRMRWKRSRSDLPFRYSADGFHGAVTARSASERRSTSTGRAGRPRGRSVRAHPGAAVS